MRGLLEHKARKAGKRHPALQMTDPVKTIMLHPLAGSGFLAKSSLLSREFKGPVIRL